MSNWKSQDPLTWIKLVVAAEQVAHIVRPTIVDGPGVYETRAGRQVVIHTVLVPRLGSSVKRCLGHHDCGTADRWSVAGRIFGSRDCDHDLMRKVSSEVPPKGQPLELGGASCAHAA